MQGAFPVLARRDGGNYIGLVVVYTIDHVTDAARALHFEAQTGAQADQLKQVGGNSAKVAGVIEKCQWCCGFVDHYSDHRVLAQPVLFALRELQFAISQQQVAACAPAFENVLTGSA
ncbi:hypothetical protein D3C84_691500 [compost metagenome]